MPSPELIQKALALIERRPVNHAYFFRKLDSPDWIKPLVEEGLFQSPPSPQRVDEDLISFPPWPESEYLARMAPLAPKEVGVALLGIPTTPNESVHMDLARAAAHVPLKMAARWAKKEAAWLSEQDRVHMPIAEALGPVMGRLAESGRVGVAMALAKALLELRTVTDSDGRRLVREPSAAYASATAASCDEARRGEDGGLAALAAELMAVNLSTRIVPRVDEYEYEEFVQQWVPVLLTHGGTHALAMLCDILEPRRDTDELDEYTDTVSRAAIEAHHQNYGHGPADALIDAVRDGSKQLVAAGIDIRSVAQVLSGRRSAIFQRILLHLAKEHCGKHPRFAAELAVSEDRFFDDRLLHEYSGLLGAVFLNLRRSERATVLSWIEDGPSLDDRFDGDEEARRRIRLHWQARRLAWVRQDLDEEWQRRYALIVAEVGEPEHPDFISYTTSWMGPTSPMAVADLEAMSPTEVAVYLVSWQPTGDPMSPDREGLARFLEEAVARSPSRYLAARDSFVDLPPRYVEALVRGLRNAVLADRLVDWAAVLEVLASVVHRPAGDREWRSARRESASMLVTGLGDDVIRLGFRAAVWKLIDALADDPEPAPEDEAERILNITTDSISSVRGNALHAVIRYALWVCRSLAGPNGAHGVRPSMDTIPEVRRRLDWHLDPANDPSLAVRSVYGQWFPHLALIDADWAERNVDRIFPQRHPALRDAAWEAYIRFCPAYDTPFKMLRGQYAAAVNRLGAGGARNPSPRDELCKRLGVHLLVMSGRGHLSWSDDDALLKGYLEDAKPEQARSAIGSIGRDLHNENHEFPPETLARFASLAEALIGVLQERGRERMGHLVSLGWWIASGRFEAEWTLRQLERLVEHAGRAEPRRYVMDHLAELSGRHPAETLAVLESWIDADVLSSAGKRRRVSTSALFGRTNSAQRILRAALASPSTRDRARSLKERLLAAGYEEFRGIGEGQR